MIEAVLAVAVGWILGMLWRRSHPRPRRRPIRHHEIRLLQDLGVLPLDRTAAELEATLAERQRR